ncbi:substrate-binding domain-containing protein, partial [Planctomycetota bacterium]
FGLKMEGCTNREIDERVLHVAEMLKIGHLVDREDIKKLSGGEKQRVALARALAIDSRVLFLDEPFCALDASIRYELIEEFGALRKKLGITVIFITHDLNEAMLVADRMAVIINGRLRQIGSPEQVYEHPETVSVAKLLRVENILPVDEIESSGLEWAGCKVGDLDVFVSEGVPRAGKDGRMYVGVRSRYVDIRAEVPDKDSGENWYEGTVERISGPPSARKIEVRARSEHPLLVECEHVEDGETFTTEQQIFFRLPRDRVFLIREGRWPKTEGPKAEKKKKKGRMIGPVIILAISLLLAGIIVRGLLPGARKTSLRVSAAVILDRGFAKIEEEFEKEHPDIDVKLDIEPSVTIARMASQRKCDVLAVVDHTLVRKMLSRRDAPWVAQFAASEMVLVYTGDSKYRDGVDQTNWYEILLRDDVKYAYSNPELNPCGYFTLLCWKLAEDYYGHEGLCEKLVRNCSDRLKIYDPPALLTALQVGTVDYTFVPKPHADDLDLPYLRLPGEINCGDPSLVDHYRKFKIDVPDYNGGVETVSGSYVDLGIAVLEWSRNKEVAELFVKFVLSEKGKGILRHENLRTVDPPIVPEWCEKLPAFLKE